MRHNNDDDLPRMPTPPVLTSIAPDRIGMELGELVTLSGSFDIPSDSTKQLCKFFPAIVTTAGGSRANTVWNTPAGLNKHMPSGTRLIGALYANLTVLNSTHAQCASPDTI